MKPEHFRYFALREALDPLRERWRELDEEQRSRRTPELRIGRPPLPGQRAMGLPFRMMRNENPKSWPQLREAAKSANIDEYIEDLNAQARPEGAEAAALGELRRGLKLLRAMLDAVERGLPDRALFVVASPTHSAGPLPQKLRWSFFTAMQQDLGLEIELLMKSDAILVRGLAAMPLLSSQVGTHMIARRHEGFEPLQAFAVPLPDGVEPFAALAEWQQTQNDDLDAFGPVVRLYQYDPRDLAFRGALDFLTGLVSGPGMPPEFLRAAMIEGLA